MSFQHFVELLQLMQDPNPMDLLQIMKVEFKENMEQISGKTNLYWSNKDFKKSAGNKYFLKEWFS